MRRVGGAGLASEQVLMLALAAGARGSAGAVDCTSLSAASVRTQGSPVMLDVCWARHSYPMRVQNTAPTPSRLTNCRLVSRDHNSNEALLEAVRRHLAHGVRCQRYTGSGRGSGRSCNSSMLVLVVLACCFSGSPRSGSTPFAACFFKGSLKRIVSSSTGTHKVLVLLVSPGTRKPPHFIVSHFRP